MSTEQIEHELKQLIHDVCPTFDIVELHDDTSLLRDIGLDSVQIIELVVALEERFNMPIFDEDLSADLFDQFNRLSQFVHQKVQSRAQA